MDTGRRVTVGASILAAAMTITGTPGTGRDSGQQAVAATGLTPFSDCAALQDWYVSRTIDQVGPYGWGGQRWTTRRGFVPDTATAGRLSADGSPATAAADGGTGTNTQEAGVDEPDVAKTDGRLVVRLVDGRRVLLTDVSGGAPRELGSWRLPSGTYADGLLLVDDHVLVTVQRSLGFVDDVFDGRTPDRVLPGTQRPESTDVYDLDVSDPAAPVLDGHTSWKGRRVSLVEHDGVVRLVTSAGLPDLPFVRPGLGGLSPDEATARNKQVVAATTGEDWLPTVATDGRTRPGPGCADVLHPPGSVGTDAVTVSTFEPGDVEEPRATTVTGAGDVVYASADRLYVTATGLARTVVHAFATEGAGTRYVASGTVDGTVRDRWSLDEHDDRLRMALSWTGRDGLSEDNGISVLEERGGRLVTVGTLRRLGVREEVQAVRWFDDLAVVVTFRQTDPVHTVDLSDPARPRLLGALHLPGFSSYLHPIGGDRLLGLGTAAGADGTGGAMVSVLDVGDPRAARELDRLRFGPESWLEATEDPHAFTWLPEVQAAVTTLEQWGAAETDGDQTSLVLVTVSPGGTLASRPLPDPGGAAPRALPLGAGRVALVGSAVRVVDLLR